MKKQTHTLLKYLFLIFLLISLISSCNIFKHNQSVDNKNKKKTGLNNKSELLFKNIKSNYLQFNTFYSGFSGNFEQNGKTFPLKGIIKIKKDTFIQISIRPALGIELAKILLTNDSIKYLDRIKNEYLSEDYIFLKQKFGIELNYKIIQSVLVNQFFVYPKNNKIEAYKLSFSNDSSYLFTSETNFPEKFIKHTIKIAQNNFCVKQNKILLTKQKKDINILYSEFYKIKNSNFPKKIKIKLNDNQIKSIINISYKNISLNKSLNSNFVIPNNYKKIKID